MIPIIICEDDLEQRKRIEAIIHNHILIEDYQMKTVLSTDNPNEVMAYLNARPNQNGFYILDINLNHEMNGLSLAAHIREKDTYAKIIFVTSHIELSPLTFKYKVEALDYIVKDDPGDFINKIKLCIDEVHKRYTTDKLYNTGYYQVKDDNITRLIPFDDIMFFTTGFIPHKLTMHLYNSHIHFYGNIKTLDKISPDFIRTHKSFVVNLHNIKHINRKEKTIEMINGEIALIAIKKIRMLLDAMPDK